MPKVITLDKGSKRRLRGIRWSVSERVSAATLFLFLVGLCIIVALWSASHSLDAIHEHWLEHQR